MTSSLRALRQLLSESLRDWRSGVTTDTGSTTALTHSALADRGNNYFQNWWVVGSTGDPANRRINTSSSTGGVLTPYVAFATAPSLGITYELHRLNPDELDTAIKKACRLTYPHLRKEIVDKTLVTGNWLPNASFEDWASATIPDKWSIAGAGLTVAANTTVGNFRKGSTSCAITRAGTNGYLYIDEDDWPALLDLENTTIDVKMWVKSSVASQCRIQVYTKTQAGVEATTNGSYHTGGGEFELLTNLSVSIPNNLADIEIRITSDGSNTVCYVDDARLLGIYNYKYLLPSQFPYFPARIFVQDDSNSDDLDEEHPWQEVFRWRPVDDGTNKFIELTEKLDSARKLILKGDGYLTQPSTNSDTVEIGEPETNALIAYAAFWFYRSLAGSGNAEETGRYREARDYWWSEWNKLKPAAIRMTAMRP